MFGNISLQRKGSSELRGLRAKTSKTTGGAQTARSTSTPPAVFISRSPGGGGVSVSRVSSYQHLKCSGNLIITMTSLGGGREGCYLTYRTISTCERNDCLREEAKKHLIVVGGEGEGRFGDYCCYHYQEFHSTNLSLLFLMRS